MCHAAEAPQHSWREPCRFDGGSNRANARGSDGLMHAAVPTQGYHMVIPMALENLWVKLVLACPCPGCPKQNHHTHPKLVVVKRNVILELVRMVYGVCRTGTGPFQRSPMPSEIPREPRARHSSLFTIHSLCDEIHVRCELTVGLIRESNSAVMWPRRTVAGAS